MPSKILVVEDHPDSREMLTTLLRNEGFTVISAEDGRLGFDIADAEQPDIIITDINMPHLDGIEMIKLLRDKTEFNKTPILVLTAFQSGSKVLAINAGANKAMNKPVEFEQLVKAIKKLLE